MANSHYCSHCGVENVPRSLVGETYAPVVAQNLVIPSTDSPQNLGPAIAVWRKTRARVRFKSKPAVDLDWVSSIVDVVLTNNAVVFVAASPPSKVYSSADKVGKFAIASGAVAGGLLVALPLAIAAEAYEKYFGHHNNLEEGALLTLFEMGRVFWIRKADARFRHLRVGGIFSHYPNVSVVSGLFRHNQGPIAACLALSDDDFSKLNEVPKSLEKAGFQMEYSKLKTAAQADTLLDGDYPFPNWSQILAGI